MTLNATSAPFTMVADARTYLDAIRDDTLSSWDGPGLGLRTREVTTLLTTIGRLVLVTGESNHRTALQRGAENHRQSQEIFAAAAITPVAPRGLGWGRLVVEAEAAGAELSDGGLVQEARRLAVTTDGHVFVLSDAGDTLAAIGAEGVQFASAPIQINLAKREAHFLCTSPRAVAHAVGLSQSWALPALAVLSGGHDQVHADELVALHSSILGPWVKASYHSQSFKTCRVLEGFKAREASAKARKDSEGKRCPSDGYCADLYCGQLHWLGRDPMVGVCADGSACQKERCPWAHPTGGPRWPIVFHTTDGPPASSAPLRLDAVTRTLIRAGVTQPALTYEISQGKGDGVIDTTHTWDYNSLQDAQTSLSTLKDSGQHATLHTHWKRKLVERLVKRLNAVSGTATTLEARLALAERAIKQVAAEAGSEVPRSALEAVRAGSDQATLTIYPPLCGEINPWKLTAPARTASRSAAEQELIFVQSAQRAVEHTLPASRLMDAWVHKPQTDEAAGRWIALVLGDAALTELAEGPRVKSLSSLRPFQGTTLKIYKLKKPLLHKPQSFREL